jgi:hypothetical protein
MFTGARRLADPAQVAAIMACCASSAGAPGGRTAGNAGPFGLKNPSYGGA